MQRYLKHRILKHIAHQSYSPQQSRDLAKAIGVEQDDYNAFALAVRELVEENQIVYGVNETIALPPLGSELVGKFKRNDRGFGFVIPDQANNHGDLYVSARDTMGAMTGDRVRAEVVRSQRGREGGRGGPAGRIVEIIQRGQTSFVGELQKKGGSWMVFPDGRTLGEPIVVRDPSAKNAKPGDKVVVEITVYPEGRMLGEGVITEVLGDSGAPSVETRGVMVAYGLADAFPDDAKDEARDAVRDYNENEAEYFVDRLDARQTFTVTIDPPDAKDFDDAISITRTDTGWELGVHIADVATFVRPGSVLDDEAISRGNSTYLPRKVIPMLPEVLSNGICSLQPGVPRLTKSAFITYDSDGKPIASRFASAVISSDFRLTYLEAQALIDGDSDEAAAKQAVEKNTYTDELRQALAEMDNLAKTIRRRRFAEGMIVLDLPEVELVFDDDGHVIDAQPEDDAYTHKVIEMFMVEANEAVARAFNDLSVPVIRRIHPDPGAHETKDLRQFARVAGFNIPNNPTRSELQALLDATRGKPAAKAVHLAVLKTLTRAEYAPQIVGHFALASEHYLHFTSPIRRYPDLTAHRALEALFEYQPDGKVPSGKGDREKLARQLMDDDRCPDEPVLAQLAKHCSTTERNAEAAERELRNLLVLQLLTNHVGEEFPATVTGVTSFGVYLQIDKYLVEGLIRTGDLPGAPAERWMLNRSTGAMTAQRSGRLIQIGGAYTVRIDRIDLARREMDLRIVEDERFRRRKPTPRQDALAPKHKGGRRTKHATHHKGKGKGGGKGGGRGKRR